jgi:hypothetical protein
MGEYYRYLKQFKSEADQRIEAHLNFEVKTGFPNPNFPLNYANEIERRLAGWRDDEVYPGVKFIRNQLKFSVDLVAIHCDGHVDYFERILTDILNYQYINGLDNATRMAMNPKLLR